MQEYKSQPQQQKQQQDSPSSFSPSAASEAQATPPSETPAQAPEEEGSESQEGGAVDTNTGDVSPGATAATMAEVSLTLSNSPAGGSESNAAPLDSSASAQGEDEGEGEGQGESEAADIRTVAEILAASPELLSDSAVQAAKPASAHTDAEGSTSDGSVPQSPVTANVDKVASSTTTSNVGMLTPPQQKKIVGRTAGKDAWVKTPSALPPRSPKKDCM